MPTYLVTNEDETVNINITASGITNETSLMYRWRKRGRGRSLPNKASGVNGTVLTIPNLVESDEGVYYCTVTNEWGNSERSDDVTLRVQGIYLCMQIYLILCQIWRSL